MKFKFIFPCLIFFIASFSSAQDMIGNILPRLDNGVLERNRLDKKKNEGVTGTPYVAEKFLPAEIKNSAEKMNVRYNTQSDEVEISYNESIFVLPKKPEYDRVDILTGQSLFLLNYLDVRNANVYGYLFEIFSGKKIKLYLKQRSVIIPEKQPQSSYDTYMPARFSRTADEYYFSFNGNIVEFPGKKKDLLALFPERKKDLEAFIKTNKIKFKSEDDFVKLATLIDSF
jgi:hypothetical protein